MPTLNDLGKQIKAKYPGKYDDLSDLELGRRALARYPSQYADFSGADTSRVTVAAHTRAFPSRKPQEPAAGSAGASTPAGGGASFAGPEPRHEPALVSMLPTAGGIVGGLAGGGAGAAAGGFPALAAGPAGAALGGAGGEAVRELIDRALGIQNVPQTPQEAAGRLLGAGTGQGLVQATGEAVGPALARTGTALMGAALKVAPEAAQTAVREGITATAAGARKLMARLGDYGGRVAAMIRQNPQTFDPTDILNGGGRALVDQVVNDQTGGAPAKWAAFRQLAQDFVARHTDANGAIRPLTAPQLQAFKQQAQDVAGPIFRKMAAGEPLTPLEAANASWHKAMGDYAQQVLENTTPDMIDPRTGKALSLADANRETGNLIKLKDAILPAAKDVGTSARVAGRVFPAAAGATVGAVLPGNRYENAALGAGFGLAGPAALAAATSPQALSSLSLMLANPVLANVLAQIPRAAGAGLTLAQAP